MAERLQRRQDELREAAEANRALLLEVYHRVKNNLQMIASLLNLQSRRALNPIEREALERIQTRVYSLSLVHERLYHARNLDQAPLDSLVEAIARHLAESSREAEPRRPVLNLDLDAIVASPDNATPVALFLNEAMTNAVKYAWRSEGRPAIDVSLKAAGKGFVLSVANDAEETRPQGDHDWSLGLRLMRGFARQLRAAMRRERRDGRHVVTLDVSAQAMKSEPEPA
jgi:two-component sensor histidine kinase